MKTQRPNELRRDTLLTLFAVLIAGYWLSSHLLGGKASIEIGNAMLVSSATGIACAYAPVAWRVIFMRSVPGGHILSLGIFLGATAIAYRTGASIIWREFGSPVTWLNSSLWGFHLALGCCSAICHLIAPGVVAGSIPKWEWMKIGILIGAGTFVIALTLLLDLTK